MAKRKNKKIIVKRNRLKGNTATAPQTVRNERRVIFFIIFVLQTSGLSVPGSCFRIFLGYGTIVSQSENRFDHKREKSR